ncbi:methyltransferase domain-containing protein [Streptomyces sp. J2-1]|nr:methyltransferase domain-containing protein [Streptomyces corallincola]
MFHALRDSERRLLAEQVPAGPGAVALDVGCGPGELARHLAGSGFEVDAVDWSDAALERAGAAAANGAPSVSYRRVDIERDDLDAVLRPAYDLVVFRLSWAFVQDRTRVMNRVRERLRPGGTVCVVTPLVDAVAEDKRHIALDELEIEVLRDGWGTAERYDADGLAFVVLRDPVPVRTTCSGKGQPTPHALTGTGVVVTDEAGRVLLGYSLRRGVWELPGGKNDGDEEFRVTAVRELAEETGLTAEAADAVVAALLMDSVGGVPRLTAAVRVTVHSGTPVVAEPHLIARWEWHDPADLAALPQPLFTPSAHVIDTFWPGLLPGLPPVHRYPVRVDA